MRLCQRSFKGWSRLFRSRLFRCIADGLRFHPRRTLRHIWIVNPFAPATWLIFSLNIHGEIFLRDFTEACGEADMNPFLMWGTLLGCVREGDFLKHDHDIDIGILSRDWPKRSLLIEAMRRRGYGLEFSRNYKMRSSAAICSRIWILDVFFPWERKMICFESRKATSWLRMVSSRCIQQFP